MPQEEKHVYSDCLGDVVASVHMSLSLREKNRFSQKLSV